MQFGSALCSREAPADSNEPSPSSRSDREAFLLPARSTNLTALGLIAQLPLPVPSSSTLQLQSRKLLNNPLTLQIIFWEAFAKVAEPLKLIKASELKQVTSSLKIKNYPQLNESELLVALTTIA